MTSTNLHYLGLLEVGKLIQSRQLSPVEATQAQLDRSIAGLEFAGDALLTTIEEFSTKISRKRLHVAG